MALHIGLIMDGNGRWALARNKPRYYGHKAGLQAFKAIIDQAAKAPEIAQVTAYALSRNNLKRSAIEIKALLELLEQVLHKERNFFIELGVQVNFIGSFDFCSEKLQQLLLEFTNITSKGSSLILNVALGYSAQEQLVELMPKALKAQDPIAWLNQKLTPIDLLIRTSGERRLSDFCLWQLAYAEIYFADCFWPDFDGKEFNQALDWFWQRDRRFGELHE